MNYEEIQEIVNYGKTLNVLFIEDNDEVREQITKLLTNFFPNIITACDGEQGLTYYDQFFKQKCKYFDLVITDINLPKKDGIDLAQEILYNNPNQLILVISAYTEVSKHQKLEDIGIYKFIQKPIDYNNFLFTIRDTINKLKVSQEKL